MRPLLLRTVVSALASVAIVLGLLFAGATGAHAQGERGAITGVTLDSSNAFLPGVTVTATNVATNVDSVGVTSDAGVYRISALTPGTYRVRAELEGFKTRVVENVVISVAQTATVDFALEVGELAESVTVTAGALLDRGSAEIRRSVSPEEFKKWAVPVSGDGLRLPQDFIFRNLPGAVGGSFQGTINGGQEYSHEIVLEGISLGRWDLTGGSNNEFTPTADAISEFSVQTGTISAQYGATQTAVANFALKSGTNQLEGGAYFYYQDRDLTATHALDNFLGREKAALNMKNAGWTLGGPVVLPKLYDGHNKTFFFAFSEHTRRNTAGTSGFRTMPTQAMEGGDFSGLLDPGFTGDQRSGTQVGVDTLGRPVRVGQLYDPRTTRQLADGTFIRDPFPGNRIPRDQWSAISGFIVDGLAHPDPELSRFLDNYPSVAGQPRLDINTFGTKLTHTLADRHKISGFFNWNRRPRFNSSFG
ncbi:MAG: carboxypeptidase regulatory-like domain-containing protein, partial [Vicinamibacteraceae bacterium]